MILQALSVDHFNQLFQFEFENRIWFETHISSRGEEFYTTKGIRSHIRKAVEDTKLRRSYSGVLIENGHISARANLKNICNAGASCEVGYRVAHHSVGKGRGTYCLKKLIDIARTEFKIKEMTAKVLSNNPASMALLRKNGFEEYNYKDNYTELNGQVIGCTLFKRVIVSG